MVNFIQKRIVDATLLWRDWRGGQLNLIVTALLLAVMVVTSVSLLADRVDRGLSNQISSFLAADLALRGRVQISDEYKDKAHSLKLETASVAEFQSMVFVGDKNHLASLKVVQSNYPLRGKIELVDQIDSTQVNFLSHGPNKGEVWVEPRLLSLIQADIGDTVEIGYASLTIKALIVNEPDRGVGFASSGARIIMSDADLADSRLIRPGSRVRYKMLMSGSEQAIVQYQQWYQGLHGQDSAGSTRNGAERNAQGNSASGEQSGSQGNKQKSHYRLMTPESSEQRLGQALQRGQTFLLLSGTIGVLLAGLAMALASHRYAARLTDQVALMKAWGQSAFEIRVSLVVRLLMISIVATAIGMMLGWLAHYLLLEIAKGLFNAELPLPSWRPWFVASLTGLMCMLGFALPALWHLPGIEPLKVLRRDLPSSIVSQTQRLLIGATTLFALTFWYSKSLTLSLLFLGALALLFGLCALIAFQTLKLVQRFGTWKGSYFKLGLANLWRRRAQSMIQLLGFAVTLMLLLIVIGMRTSLIAQWEEQLPEDTPSHFIYNVSSSEVDQVQGLLDQQDVATNTWFPMVLGRLVGMNGQAITPARLNRSRGLSREVNLTQAVDLPPSNSIVSGQWWDESEVTNKASPNHISFSMEQEVANEIGLVLGDNVEFSIGGITFTAKLSSLREVDWQSMNLNFYVIFEPHTLDRFAPNWVTSVSAQEIAPSDDAKVLASQAPFVTQMVTHFPTSVVLELSHIIDRIRNVITRVTQALELIMILVLACGAVVLFASIAVSHDERVKESAILRTLGSSRKLILGALMVEYAVLGLIAGLLAGIGAELVLYFVQIAVFELTPSFHPVLWLIGVLSGVLLITVLGLFRSRELVTVPPLQSLRQVL